MKPEHLKPNVTVRGPLFPEPIHVLVVQPMGGSVKLIGTGLRTNLTYQRILSDEQLAQLEATPEKEPFDGDPLRFQIGVEALRLGLAYEYDPYFSLSIARVDPLPHQLEAVYDYFLKLPRIRFLLADDPGAGKTIMAGLLIKELKIRGLAKRILVVTPANLSFQWQRELKDKFREHFRVIRSPELRANYGSNPWQEHNQVITSVSWVSTVDDAHDSLMRSHWDLVIVDEAHKMSAYSADKKTLAYQLGEKLSELTNHYLLMTATPHKGNPENFCLFLRLLDKDVYGDIKSLDEAMARHEAPFYLRRVKEAMVTFPDPETGEVKSLFTKRNVRTSGFQIDSEELEFYDELTRFVEDQSIQASQDNSARGRALGFTMALLQRRFASSTFAARRTLERMKLKREEILKDPEAYRKKLIDAKLPEEFEDLPEEEQEGVIAKLEEAVASFEPSVLRDEILQLDTLIRRALALEKREVESKLRKLKQVLTDEGIFGDPKMKLLLFTEHKDTLDYLVAKLRNEWNLRVSQIHGGMKIGDRDTPGTRLHAEREFKESSQVLVATEAAGEGINLQFCWFMINYDIPWNPVRLEQRMGRIHRYLQEKDCLIINFVATNTREGRVLQKLFDRIKKIEDDLDPKRTGKIFNVIGEIFPPNYLERMLREMYARNLTDQVIIDRIVKDADPERFRSITNSTLEGLAKRELNLSAIVGKSAEAKERRLVPEVIEDFFRKAAPLSGISPQETAVDSHVYKIGRVPRNLWPVGDRLEPRFGQLGKEYKRVVFDRLLLAKDPTNDWVTPGHPLFEVVREDVLDQTGNDLKRGAVFFDLNCPEPIRLDVFSASVRDGRGNLLHRRLFVIETAMAGEMTVRQPTRFLDLSPTPSPSPVPDDSGLPDRDRVEQFLIENALQPFLEELRTERERENSVIRRHMEISLKVIIDRLQNQLGDLITQKEAGSMETGLDGRLKQFEDRLMEQTARLEHRSVELTQERECAVGDIQHLGRAWVLPHPERKSPAVKAMLPDDRIEKIAVEAVRAYEESQGRAVESVEADNRGFDLISRKPHPEDPRTAIDVRFIEVKGRSGVGEVALSPNEYKTAERLKQDYWLYVVYNCETNPKVHIVQNPVRLGWQPLVKLEHYHVGASEIIGAS